MTRRIPGAKAARMRTLRWRKKRTKEVKKICASALLTVGQVIPLASKRTAHAENVGLVLSARNLQVHLQAVQAASAKTLDTWGLL